MRGRTRVAKGALLAAVLAGFGTGCGGFMDDDDDKKSTDSTKSTSSAASPATSESTDSGTDSTVKEATPPKVVARNAVVEVGGSPKLVYRVTDESPTRETITIWRGQKRLALVAGKELEAAGQRTVEPFPNGDAEWLSKPGALRWCVRAFDASENKSKVACAKLRVRAAGTSTSTDTDAATTDDSATSEAETTGSDAESSDATSDEATDDSSDSDSDAVTSG